nr:hypothetical protein [Morchella crassipes]
MKRGGRANNNNKKKTRFHYIYRHIYMVKPAVAAFLRERGGARGGEGGGGAWGGGVAHVAGKARRSGYRPKTGQSIPVGGKSQSKMSEDALRNNICEGWCVKKKNTYMRGPREPYALKGARTVCRELSVHLRIYSVPPLRSESNGGMITGGDG